MRRFRRGRVLVPIILTAALLGACSGDDEPEAPTTDEGARIVEHQYGETEIEGTPERVVSLGLTDADPLLAVGVTPVAVRPGYDVAPVGPWAKKALGKKTPKVFDAESAIDTAAVETLNPDLIVAISEAVDEKTYNALSKIAPTIVRPDGYLDHAVPWEVATTMVGRATDKEVEATEAIEATQEAVAEVGLDNPRLGDGPTGEIISAQPDGGWRVYLPADARGQFLAALGIQPPRTLAHHDKGGTLDVAVNEKSATDLEADVIVALGDGKDQELFEKNKVFQGLAATKRDAVVHVSSPDIETALAYTTVLSLPYALDGLVPRIAAVLA